MNNRLLKYSVAASLAFLLAVPAIAFSQIGSPEARDLANNGPAFSPDPAASFAPGAPQRGAMRGPQEPGRGRAAAMGRGQRQFGQRGRMAGRGFGGRESARGGDRFAAGGRLGVRRGVGATGSRGAGLAARALVRADDIALTAEQRSQIEEVRRARQESSIQRRADSQVATLELGDLMSAETHDVAAIEAKLRELSDHRIAEQIASLRLDETVSQVLTAEQLEQLEELGPRDARSRRGRPARRGPGRGPR